MTDDPDPTAAPARRGPRPLPAAQLRRHTVSARLSAAELEELDRRREPVRMQRGQYLREAALNRLPPVVPEINRDAWLDLARTAGNLNQLARRLHAGQGAPAGELERTLAECRQLLVEVRDGLIGVRAEDEP